jgi:hypothetical protein
MVLLQKLIRNIQEDKEGIKRMVICLTSLEFLEV